MDRLGKDHTDELCAACKDKIGFDGFGISGFEVCKSEGIFEDIDRSFHKDAVLVEIVPMFSVARDAGAGSEILIRICIGAFAILSNDVREEIKSFFNSELRKKQENFANGRFVRNIFDELIMNHAKRLENIVSPSRKQLSMIESADFALCHKQLDEM